MRESEDGGTRDITAADARAALDAVDRARAHVVDEVGLPRWYWWMMAAAWSTDRLQVSADTAGHRLPLVVVGMLLILVAVTIAAALALHADGAQHPGIGAAVLVAAIAGLGGPGILRILRSWVHA